MGKPVCIKQQIQQNLSLQEGAVCSLYLTKSQLLILMLPKSASTSCCHDTDDTVCADVASHDEKPDLSAGGSVCKD